MADNLSNYLENKLLEHSTGKAAWTAPTKTYLGLYTVTPTDSTSGTEVAGGNYARIQLSWGTASEGQIATNAAAKFPSAGTASVNFGTITALAISDALTEGNILWYSPLSPTFTINTGDTFQVISGGITLSLS
jgi:hypothetical protein